MKIMYQVIKHYYNIHTRYKLLLSYVIVVVIPVLLIGLLLTSSLREMAMENAISEATNNVARVSQRIQDALKIPRFISVKLSASTKLQDIVSTNYNNDWEIINTYYNYKEFQDLQSIYSEVEEIRLYTENKTMLNNWIFVPANRIEGQPWYQKAVMGNGVTVWEYMDFPGKVFPTPGLSMIRYITSSAGVPLGTLVVKMVQSELNKILKQESFDTMIVDESGIVIIAQDNKRIGQSLDSLGIKVDLSTDEKLTDMEYKDRPSKILHHQFNIPESGERFAAISIFSVDDILSEAKKKNKLGLSLIIGSLSLSFLLIIIFSRALSTRIQDISTNMHRVAMGDFDFISNIEGEDEIGQLSNDLNRMVGSLKKLIHEVYESNLQKNQLLIKQKDIKFKMLANQINPHFLFNSLEAIRMKAISNDEKEIATIVKLLGKLMRTNLKLREEMIPLQNELDMIDNYLQIQKFRYGDKINYLIDKVSYELSQYKILPLSIQPIIENAIVHGLENKVEVGTVSVKVNEEENQVIIRVIDDGIGIPQHKLKDIRESLDAEEDRPGRRIGLANINQRIMLQYGDKYGIQIYSEEGQGTAVELWLPKGG